MNMNWIKEKLREGDSLLSKHLYRVLAVLVVAAVVTTLYMYLQGFFQYKKAVEYKFSHLSQKEAAGLVVLSETADLPGAQEARDVVTRYERKQEIAREKWLAAQEKRVAAAKKKAAEAARKKAEEDAKSKVQKEAEKNTKATWSGSGWNGRPLTRSRGAITGPSGKETYYNLNMSGCVRMMRRMGFSEKQYPYAVRKDGVKTLGGYVMVAANLKLRPRGSFIMTSCGVGIVVDTGGFARRNPTQLDLATNW